MTKPKLLFFVTEDWYFCTHRLPLAIAAKEAGFDVTVLTRVNKHSGIIEDAGLRLIPSSLLRRGQNPVYEASFIRQLTSIYRKEKPDIVHHVAMKPVLYGSLAARLAGCKHVVNAMAGMGFVFTSDQLKARLLRPLVSGSYRLLLNHPGSRLILQNSDDVALFTRSGLIDPQKIALIRGAGVDTRQYTPTKEASGRPIVVMASRLLWDKGVGEFVNAAKSLKQQGVDALFVLVGEGDRDNPSAVPDSQLQEWHQLGVIEWWGRREDMPQIFAQAHVVVLPTTYGEGVPKVLLEAASCERPIVTTDWPGCREIVQHGENGLLVPPKNALALADAIKTLLQHPEMRQRMGAAGRKIVEQEFSQELVIDQTLNLYREMLR